MNLPVQSPEHFPAENLHALLGFQERLEIGEASRKKQLWDWRMEADDAPIFRFIYRNFKPKRHLEFGTWKGTGTVYCLEECQAVVWTLNLLFGENAPDGDRVYSFYDSELESVLSWAEKIGMKVEKSGNPTSSGLWSKLGLKGKEKSCTLENLRTDSIGFIGREYLEKGFGHRVCQMYCDSKEWATEQYPEGFFDSALIDGGHTHEVVANDTAKALRLVRSGGLIMWHDYCPDAETLKRCDSPRGVCSYIHEHCAKLKESLDLLGWIKPSWILLGRKK
ncbi:MAG: class I SAM-dependent methyltransferase [Planctomycetota bacterium]|nr:class I SAM-dependent methyltransferase [Planctomycetota bacterium]